MFFSFDWQVELIISYLEDFASPVNLFGTTRLSRGFRYTKTELSLLRQLHDFLLVNDTTLGILVEDVKS